MGLGESGQSVAVYLHSQGIPVTVSDDCQDRLKKLQEHHPWMVASDPDPERTIVVSPGISPKHPMLQQALSRGQRVISDMSLFFHFFPNIKAVGITGSVGKTTSCYLVHNALKNQGIASICAGNNGRPVFSTIQDSKPFSGLYILELSSYQLEWTEYLPLEVAVLLNLSEHHLERHGTLDRYRQTKEKIFRHAKTQYACTHWIRLWGHAFPKVKKYAQKDGNDIAVKNSTQKDPLPFMSRPHNRHNQRAAQAVLSALGYRWDDALFCDFQGPNHRQEYAGSWQNIVYINDSKSTSPSSVRSALTCMPQPLLWIAGGVLQKDDLDILKCSIHSVQKAFLIGQSAPRYGRFLSDNGIPFQYSDSLEHAVQSATEHALPTGGVVLFSPGCASFDQFDHFVHRGNVFKSIVEKIKNHTTR
jgi:UDP-N-acetylmuramoylalanine--D-glutamate ligase